MKKRLINEVFLIAFIVELYLTITLFYELNTNINGQLFMIISVIFTGSTLAYLFGQIFSLYSALIFAVGYGTYLLYLSLMNINISLGSYLIMFISPFIFITLGSYSSYIKQLKVSLTAMEEKVNKFVTVDPSTGLENITAFNLDLQKQMSFAKRYNSNLYLMIIEIKYYEELKSLYKQEGIKEIVKQAAKLLNDTTRLEDNKYRLTDNSFAIVFRNIKDSGIEVIKTKIKSTLNEANVKNINGETDIIHIEVKLGYLKFKTDIKSSTEYYNLTKKELVYDV